MWRSVLQNNAVVDGAEEFFNTAQRVCKKINVLYISEQEVKDVADNISHSWQKCRAIPQTNAVHYVTKSSDSTLVIAKNLQFFKRDGYQEHILIPEASVPKASLLFIQNISPFLIG